MKQKLLGAKAILTIFMGEQLILQTFSIFQLSRPMCSLQHILTFFIGVIIAGRSTSIHHHLLHLLLLLLPDPIATEFVPMLPLLLHGVSDENSMLAPSKGSKS